MGAAATDTRAIHLPEETVRAIEARIEHTGFATPDAFVAFVLARLLEEPAHGAFTPEDEARLRERLRSLGYID